MNALQHIIFKYIKSQIRSFCYVFFTPSYIYIWGGSFRFLLCISLGSMNQNTEFVGTYNHSHVCISYTFSRVPGVQICGDMTDVPGTILTTHFIKWLYTIQSNCTIHFKTTINYIEHKPTRFDKNAMNGLGLSSFYSRGQMRRHKYKILTVGCLRFYGGNCIYTRML